MQGFIPRRRFVALVLLLTVTGAGCAAPRATPVATPAATQAAPLEIAQAGPTAPLATAIVASPTAAPSAVPVVSAPTATSAPTAPPPEPTATPSPEAAVQVPEVTELEPFDPALAEELQRILDETVEDGYIPGSMVAVHIPGQEPWSGASGFIDRERSRPMDPTTKMRIASISKVFTAVVVLQLVEEGALELDMPLSLWFPDLVPHSDAITVRRLLNHTTGLYDYLEDQTFLSEAFERPDYRWPPDELVAYAARHAAAFYPGERGAWDYSSTNYVILGMLVERVTGNSLAHEMRQRIFAPLGLENTFFLPDEEIRGVRARGYRRERDQTNVSLSFAFATANIVSTASDVRQFGDALFGGRLLKPETMELMLTFQNGKGQYNMPALEYGLGVMRNHLAVGPDASGRPRPKEASRVLGHTGGFAGFRSALWHHPESGITIAVNMNQGVTDPNILATRVFDAILTAQGR